MEGITRSVHSKYYCITVNFEMTQLCIYVIQITLTCQLLILARSLEQAISLNPA